MEAEIARFLDEIGQLKLVRRSGWWLAGVRDPESVAEHSFRTAAVAYFLSQLEGADLGKTLAMSIFHDAAEARLGDLHRLTKAYVDAKGAEPKVTEEQTRGLPPELRDGLRGLIAAARDKTSLEARIVHDADRIECLLQAREYAATGHAVEEWIRTSVDELTTASARRLATAILAMKPGDWWRRARR
jgi:putative hydrolase of HD superfamily